MKKYGSHESESELRREDRPFRSVLCPGSFHLIDTGGAAMNGGRPRFPRARRPVGSDLRELWSERTPPSLEFDEAVAAYHHAGFNIRFAGTEASPLDPSPGMNPD